MPKACEDCKLCRINNILVLKCGPPKPIIKSVETKQGSSNVDMEQTYTDDRSLRIVTIITWIPAFSFLLPYGIVTESVFPALGLIPMSMSVVFGVARLLGRPRSWVASVCADLFIAAFMISMLIPGWVSLAGGHCYGWGCHGDEGMVMLGSYGTMMMMVNFCIHAWFAFRNLPYRQMLGLGASVCPHCNGDLRRGFLPVLSRTPSDHSHQSYQSMQRVEPIVMEEARAPEPEKDARPSYDTADETAPLM